MTAHTSDAAVRVVGDGAGADARTIQAAHDDLPASDEDARVGSGLIVVDSTYDSTYEEFPVRLTKYIDLIGQSRTRSQIVCEDPDADVIRVKKRAGNRPGTRTRLANLTVRGGRDGIVLDGANYVSGSFLTVTDTARDGIAAVREEDVGGVYGSYFERCYVRYCGRHGYHFPPPTNAHGLMLFRSSATENGGIGAVLNGFGINVLGGAYQINDDAGIVLDGRESLGAGAVGLHNTYVEYNGQTQTHPRDIVLRDGTRGATIDHSYVTGSKAFEQAETHAAIEVHGAADCRIDHCTFRGYDWCDEAGLFEVDDGATGLELGLGTHHRFGGADEVPTFLRRPPSFYANGVRHGSAATDVAGRYDGEMAYADGALWLWSGDDEAWTRVGGADATSDTNDS